MRFFAAIIAALLLASQASADGQVEANVSVCFTPAEHCEGKIVQAIDDAKDTIKLQAYGFTSEAIIHALQRASQRGVEVLAILDKVNQKRYSGATLLEAYGIPVWIDYEPAIAHNKVIIIDGYLTIGGSFNYTANAERRNAENVTFTESPDIADKFTANWESRLAVSREFEENSKAIASTAE